MVNETQTLAAAMGNAVGVLNVMTSPNPELNRFKDELTDHEFDQHQYFNDDVLDLAYEIDEIERDSAEELQQMIQLYGARPQAAGPDDGLRGDRVIQAPSSPVDMSQYNWRNFDTILETRAERVEALERQIMTVMDGVEATYQRLANVLNDERKREDFIQAIQIVGRHETEIAAAVENVQLSRSDDDDWATLYGHPRHKWGFPFSFNIYDAPTEVRQAALTVLQLNSDYVDYKLTEEGVSVTVEEVTVGDVVKFGAMLVVGEIVSFGIAKFVRGIGAVVRIVQASRAATIMAARFNSLTAPVRTRLNNLFRNRRPNTRTQRADDGGDAVQNTARPASLACGSRGRVAC